MNHPSAPWIPHSRVLDGLYTLLAFGGNVKRTVAWNTGYSNDFSPRYGRIFDNLVPQPLLVAM